MIDYVVNTLSMESMMGGVGEVQHLCIYILSCFADMRRRHYDLLHSVYSFNEISIN